MSMKEKYLRRRPDGVYPTSAFGGYKIWVLDKEDSVDDYVLGCMYENEGVSYGKFTRHKLHGWDEETYIMKDKRRIYLSDIIRAR